jgi:hypothetical protein
LVRHFQYLHYSPNSACTWGSHLSCRKGSLHTRNAGCRPPPGFPMAAWVSYGLAPGSLHTRNAGCRPPLGFPMAGWVPMACEQALIKLALVLFSIYLVCICIYICIYLYTVRPILIVGSYAGIKTPHTHILCIYIYIYIHCKTYINRRALRGH